MISPPVVIGFVISVPDVGSVTFEGPVDERVIEFAPDVTREEPSARVRVADVAGAVSVSLFKLVAVAAPMFGVTSVGLPEKTKLVDVVPVVPVAALR
jgi:hypothetical protein